MSEFHGGPFNEDERRGLREVLWRAQHQEWLQEQQRKARAERRTTTAFVLSGIVGLVTLISASWNGMGIAWAWLRALIRGSP